LKWLEDEANAKRKLFDQKECKLDSKTQRQAGCPTQTDGINCGMFIIMYMDTLVKNSFVDATSFSASEMPNYRLKLAKAITRGTLSN
jgi:Ulp1 family protease